MASVNVRIDENTKKGAELVFKKIGLTPTAAITIFYKQVIRTKGIPFELKAEVPNETTLKAMDEVKAMELGSAEAKTFDTIEALMEDLSK